LITVATRDGETRRCEPFTAMGSMKEEERGKLPLDGKGSIGIICESLKGSHRNCHQRRKETQQTAVEIDYPIRGGRLKATKLCPIECGSAVANLYAGESSIST
jgi:hypothetical protein